MSIAIFCHGQRGRTDTAEIVALDQLVVVIALGALDLRLVEADVGLDGPESRLVKAGDCADEIGPAKTLPDHGQHEILDLLLGLHNVPLAAVALAMGLDRFLANATEEKSGSDVFARSRPSPVGDSGRSVEALLNRPPDVGFHEGHPLAHHRLARYLFDSPLYVYVFRSTKSWA